MCIQIFLPGYGQQVSKFRPDNFGFSRTRVKAISTAYSCDWMSKSVTLLEITQE